jgi:hypothetical protein
VTVRLLYQQTSWEYVQFLWKANDGASVFLGAEGLNFLDAWIHTGMSAPIEIAATTVAVTGPAAGTPGAVRPLVASWNREAGLVDLSWVPACDATGHAVYAGDLALVSAYAYGSAFCALGAGGTASIDPGPGDRFFLVVGNDGSREGSFGLDGAGAERPEDSAAPLCPWPQDLAGVTCE